MPEMINPGDNEYPKMVYPNGANVHHTNAGSPGQEGFGGVLVHNKAEEDEVMGKAESWKAEAPKT